MSNAAHIFTKHRYLLKPRESSGRPIRGLSGEAFAAGGVNEAPYARCWGDITDVAVPGPGNGGSSVPCEDSLATRRTTQHARAAARERATCPVATRRRISSRSWDRPLPGLSSSTRPYPGQKSCHNVSSAGRPFGATRFAKIWSPPAEGGARPHQARQNPLQRHRGANSKLQRGHATASNRPRASKPCLLPDRMHSLTLGGLPGRGKGSKPVARR